MYLIILEDNSIRKSEIITQDDKMSCDEGYIDIIRVKDCTKYYSGGWNSIEDVER